MKENGRNFVCWISCLFIHFYSTFLSSPPTSTLPLLILLPLSTLPLFILLSTFFLLSSLPSFLLQSLGMRSKVTILSVHQEKSWLNNSINSSSSSFLVPYYHIRLSVTSKWVKIWNVENDSEESQICWTLKEITFIWKVFLFSRFRFHLKTVLQPIITVEKGREREKERKN